MTTRWRRRGWGVLCVALSIATAVSALGGVASSRGQRVDAPSVVPASSSIPGWRLRHATLGSPKLARAAVTWVGGPTTASTGETVTVYVSASLSSELGTPQTWADYFAGLLHGPELRSLIAYVATLPEVQELCGGEDVVGCYGSSTLVTIGESQPYVSREEVTSHEYGHHVAANRDNSPWRAVDWGTKRWATLANICARALNAAVFPGDEGARYRLNPGEGFAEVYRAANEQKRGRTSFNWQIVDSSFYPDQAALQAAERDVLEPWVQPPATNVRTRFTAKGPKAWTRTLSTPLDGQMSVGLSLPETRPYKLALLTADGRTVLARGSWSSAKSQTLSFTVCGQRSLILRVSRAGPAGTFAVTFKTP